MTNDDPGIVCFQHGCAAGTKIFCYRLPAECPTCAVPLDGGVMPFRLPYPFVRPHQHPCAVMLKPTSGDFMNDYFNSKDLHIGITTSTGTIVEFDQRGLRHTAASPVHPQLQATTASPKNSSPTTAADSAADSWSQSLLVADAAPDAWHDHWDEVLAEVCAQPDAWTARRYDQHRHNCYTFVLAFLRRLDYGQLSEAAATRDGFCERFIVPRTTTAGKYISLYRKLRGGVEYYVHHQPAAARTNGGVGMMQQVAEKEELAEV